MSMFHSVPGVPCAKMERFDGLQGKLALKKPFKTTAILLK